MDENQKIAIAALPTLVVVMVPAYLALGRLLGPGWGWYTGFLFYWPICCILLPHKLIGWSGLRRLFRSCAMTPLRWTLIASPPVVAFAGRFVAHRPADQPLLWIAVAVINGTLEEVLWRGVYASLFPHSRLWGLVWQAVWFALWHAGPGLLSMGSQARILVAGAAFLGLALGWVSWSSGTIRWTVASHVLAGLLQA